MSEEPCIRLDEKRGVNPRLTTCTLCGKEGQELLLLGDSDYLHECKKCGAHAIHRKILRTCPKCGVKAMKLLRRLGESERIPHGLCDSCREKDNSAREMVKAGGIFWRCRSCGSCGAIAADHPFAADVREHMKIQAPDPCGVEFSDADCPVCSKKEATNGEAGKEEEG